MERQCFFTEQGPKPVGPYCTAVIANGFAFLSGMIPIDPKVGKPVTGGIEEEARQVFVNLRTVFEEMGLSMEKAVKVVVYLTDMADFAAVNGLYREVFGPGPGFPARTCVAVKELPMGVHIEVDVTACV